MKAVMQNVKTGLISIDEIPPPLVKPGTVLVQNICSLVSAGTEKAVMDFSSAGYLKKARMRPDLFRKVLNRIKNEGLLETYQVVKNLIDQPIQLGYSSAGIAIQVGKEITDLSEGQRVACAGVFKATHSEFVSVPRNLVVPIPDEIAMTEACFVALGAVAMQGLRLAKPSIGDTVAVYGIGLIGMIAAQLALAAGCRVIGLDFDPGKVALIEKFGATGILIDQNLVNNIRSLTGGCGVDSVILCAGTRSNEPVEKIPLIIRQKGILSVVGLVSLNIPQRDYLEKEIDVRFSRSYGPGRYDLSYEEGGLDYPYGYVRWTENRNMGAFIELIRSRRVRVADLVTHQFPIDKAMSAYEIIEGKRKERYLGIVITYGDEKQPRPMTKQVIYGQGEKKGRMRLGVVGAGTFAQAILLPAFAAQREVSFECFCTASGTSAASMAQKYRAAKATADPDDIFSSPDVDAVIIATRHDTHAPYAMKALKSRKAVYVEKPLAMTVGELDSLADLYHRLTSDGKNPFLMVGYNRRFSPLARLVKEVFSRVRDPISVLYRVNAGPASNEWIKDPVQGGGRIVGEVCHFIDLMTFLTGSLPDTISASSLQNDKKSISDILTATIQFSNGALGSIHYFSSGNPTMPKEYLEVFGGGICAQLRNFRNVQFYGAKSPGKTSYLNQVKGYKQEAEAFARAYLNGEKAPIAFEELYAVAKATLKVEEALASGGKVKV
jgi:polar amino acid transport system substrate-binding protein